MASASIVAGRRLQATRDLNVVSGSLARKLGIEPPVKPMKAADANMATLRMLESVLDFVRRADAALPDVPAEEPEGAPESSASVEVPAKEPEEPDDEEPLFHGFPLSHFDGMTDEEILDIKGIGQATLDKIRAAQAEK